MEIHYNSENRMGTIAGSKEELLELENALVRLRTETPNEVCDRYPSISVEFKNPTQYRNEIYLAIIQGDI